MLKVNQVAERLNCSVATVYHLIETERLPHYRCPGIRVSEEQLAEYLESCRRGPPQPAPVKFKHVKLRHIASEATPRNHTSEPQSLPGDSDDGSRPRLFSICLFSGSPKRFITQIGRSSLATFLRRFFLQAATFGNQSGSGETITSVFRGNFLKLVRFGFRYVL